MDYKKHYEELIRTRKLLLRNKKDSEYFEKHHIVPKSLGGTNSSDNLILLTFREHYIAHLLLSRMFEGESKRKMNYALWRMSSNSKNMKRILSASQYENCRIAGIEAKINHEVSDETRRKISDGHKGKIVSKETRDRISKANKGKTIIMTEETKLKISKANKGKKRTEEANQKNRERNLGKLNSPESNEKRRKKLLGVPRPKEVINKIALSRMIPIICSNGIIYSSQRSAADALNLQQANINKVLYGYRKHTGGYTFTFYK